MDISSLMQGRKGYLWKLGGGQEKGSKWNKRWFVTPRPSAGTRRLAKHSLRAAHRRFVLRDNVLMYFASPKEFTGFRDKPSGVVLLEECNVRAREGQVRGRRHHRTRPTARALFGMPQSSPARRSSGPRPPGG